MKRKFAIPTVDGRSCAHFGHCESFAVVEVNGNQLGDLTFVTPPEHQPGTFPRFLAGQQVNVVLAGGMGAMARQLFEQNGIEVHMGVGVEEPLILVEQYLRNELQPGGNLCSKEDEPDHGCRH